jgi:FAD:protein FMN transferase
MPPSSFGAMGCEVVVDGASEIELRQVRQLFEDWDRVFSRFRPGGELNDVNRTASEHVIVSARFAGAVDVALSAAAATRGLVDPTLGLAIEAAGYDRDFAGLGADERPPGATAPGRWRSVRIDGRLLSRPVGTLLDLNGVVKSLATDAALGLLAGPGVVSAGGDVAASTAVTVGLPGGAAVRLISGGLATSGSSRRRWLRGGREQHHLLDPRSGRPAESRWTDVTVSAASCLAADVAAKAAFLLSKDGPDWLDERGLSGRFLDRDGNVVANRSWREAVEPARAAA